VVNLEVGGYLEPKDTVELYADPDDAPEGWDGQRWATDIGVAYQIQHTPTPAATQMPYVDGNDNWTATRTEPVPDNEYINTSTTRPPWVPTNETNVSYFTGGENDPGWEADEGGVEYSGPTDPDGPEGGRLDIWYNESHALNMSDIYAIDKVVKGSTQYLVNADPNGCSGCGGDPPELTGSLSVAGSPEMDPIAVGDYAYTTLQNPDRKYNKTVDPDKNRGSYLDLSDSPGTDPYVESINITASENQSTPYYLWSNIGAMVEADASSLTSGEVEWRNDTGCAEIGGCTDSPNGIVDHIDGPSSTQWGSKAQNAQSNGGPAVTVSPDPASNAGRHDHNLSFYVENNGDPRPDSVVGIVTFYIEQEDFGLELYLDVGFEVETKDDPGGGDP
jgi:hypothetical protein